MAATSPAASPSNTAAPISGVGTSPAESVSGYAFAFDTAEVHPAVILLQQNFTGKRNVTNSHIKESFSFSVSLCISVWYIKQGDSKVSTCIKYFHGKVCKAKAQQKSVSLPICERITRGLAPYAQKTAMPVVCFCLNLGATLQDCTCAICLS